MYAAVSINKQLFGGLLRYTQDVDELGVIGCRNLKRLMHIFMKRISRLKLPTDKYLFKNFQKPVVFCCYDVVSCIDALVVNLVISQNLY